MLSLKSKIKVFSPAADNNLKLKRHGKTQYLLVHFPDFFLPN